MSQPITILLSVTGFIVAMIVLNGLLTWQRQQKLKRQLLADWGTFPEKRPKGERYLKAAYLDHEAQVNHDCQVDDLTWQDLDMLDVFEQLNVTQSSVGAERVYAQLRAYDLGKPAVDEALIAFFQDHPDSRLKVQMAFAGLGIEPANNSQLYLRTTTKKALPNAWRFKVMGGFPFIGVLLTLLWPAIGVTLMVVSLLVNVFYYILKREGLDAEITSMGYLVRTIITAERLAKISQPTQAALRQAVKPMRGITRFAFVFRTKTGSMGDILTEYLSIMFMLSFIAYNTVLDRLSSHHAEALALWQRLGDLELAIAIANFRTASTYVKSIAINAILAQTINTVTATSFTMEPGEVITAMAVRDDLSEGDSYFVAEIKAIRRLLNAVAKKKRVYGFIDEILKGTNTVERIAASASVINWLKQYPSLVVVATHDNELTDIMGDQCVNWHFQEKVTKEDGVVFDYLLYQGLATSHNAIALLATMDYPTSLIHDARQLAADFERSKAWPKFVKGGIQA